MLTVNYVAFFRKQNGLTQEELSELLGFRSSTTVHRVETGERQPTLRFALSCEVLFGNTPAKVFPGLYADIEEEVIRNGAWLDERIRGRTDRRASLQRDMLRRMMERAGRHPVV